MRISLNEAEIYLRRAALGCGVPVGYAEDLGAATAWLCGQGFTGVPLALADLEAWQAGETAPAAASVVAAGGWHLGPQEARPPAAWHLGPSVADLLRAGAGPVTVAEVRQPLLLLAALGVFSAAKGPGLLLTWNGGQALCRNGRAYLVAGAWDEFAGPAAQLEAAVAGPRVRGTQHAPAGVLDEGIAVDPAVWARVQALVRGTLVPASEVSRARGAGAGLVDAD